MLEMFNWHSSAKNNRIQWKYVHPEMRVIQVDKQDPADSQYGLVPVNDPSHVQEDTGNHLTGCGGKPQGEPRSSNHGDSPEHRPIVELLPECCLLYTSDAADDLLCVDLGGRRIIKKKKKQK